MTDENPTPAGEITPAPLPSQAAGTPDAAAEAAASITTPPLDPDLAAICAGLDQVVDEASDDELTTAMEGMATNDRKAFDELVARVALETCVVARAPIAVRLGEPWQLFASPAATDIIPGIPPSATWRAPRGTEIPVHAQYVPCPLASKGPPERFVLSHERVTASHHFANQLAGPDAVAAHTARSQYTLATAERLDRAVRIARGDPALLAWLAPLRCRTLEEAESMYLSMVATIDSRLTRGVVRPHLSGCYQAWVGLGELEQLVPIDFVSAADAADHLVWEIRNSRGRANLPIDWSSMTPIGCPYAGRLTGLTWWPVDQQANSWIARLTDWVTALPIEIRRGPLPAPTGLKLLPGSWGLPVVLIYRGGIREEFPERVTWDDAADLAAAGGGS